MGDWVGDLGFLVEFFVEFFVWFGLFQLLGCVVWVVSVVRLGGLGCFSC